MWPRRSRQAKCSPASSSPMQTTGRWRWRPMTLAMSRIGTPSSAPTALLMVASTAARHDADASGSDRSCLARTTEKYSLEGGAVEMDETRERDRPEGGLLPPRDDAEAGYARDLVTFARGYRDPPSRAPDQRLETAAQLASKPRRARNPRITGRWPAHERCMCDEQSRCRSPPELLTQVGCRRPVGQRFRLGVGDARRCVLLCV